MPPCYTLNQLPRGESAEICALRTSGAMRRRLMDLGFVPGETVRALYRSCSGDPVAYLINGAVIALRGEDAKGIVLSCGSCTRP